MLGSSRSGCRGGEGSSRGGGCAGRSAISTWRCGKASGGRRGRQSPSARYRPGGSQLDLAGLDLPDEFADLDGGLAGVLPLYLGKLRWVEGRRLAGRQLIE